MSLVFVDRSPTEAEVEKLRLILSTYQDGTGMLTIKDKTLPGWRDFERSTAVCFNGIALESKAIYDVLLPDPIDKKVFYGISCKMRKELRQVEKNGKLIIELSNASKEFWQILKPFDVNLQNYHDQAGLVGELIIKRVEKWHIDVDIKNGGKVDTSKSIFLCLQYDIKTGYYQLFQLPILLPNPNSINWAVISARLVGTMDGQTIIEWYGSSGGQLKYYPNIEKATWISEKFKLEHIPQNSGSNILKKVEAYFPDQWRAIKDIS